MQYDTPSTVRVGGAIPTDTHIIGITESGVPVTRVERDFRESINALVQRIYQGNVDAGWWSDLETGLPKERNDGELLMLIVTEVAEAMEGVRKNLMDDKLPHRKMAEVEMADAVIRIMDYCGGRGYDLGGAIEEKLAFNAVRSDHKIENRKGEHGKKI